MLGEHVGRAEAGVRRILRGGLHGVEGGLAFEHLEAVGRHQIGLGGLVHAVVGAADALHDPARPLRRADVHDEVDVAPVDAEIEGRGADDGAQLPRRHGGLDPPALRGIQRPVMQSDGVVRLVDAPEFLEGVLGLEPGVDEDQHRAVPPDQVVDRRHRLPGRVPGERQGVAGLEHVQVGGGTALHHHELGHRRRHRALLCGGGRDRCLRHQVTPQLVRLAHRGGEADRGQTGAEAVQARETQGQEVAALRGHQRVQFVEDDAGERGEEVGGLPVRDEQGQLLRRGQQDVGGTRDLPGALVRGGVAGARLDPDIEPHLGDGRVEVARDIDGQRLEGRDVEGVQAPALRGGRPAGEGGEARQEARQRLARARGCHQQGRMAAAHEVEQFELVRPGRPAARREPGREALRQHGRGLAQARAIRKRSISSSALSVIAPG